jgi:AraC-like DNA-binding protein
MNAVPGFTEVPSVSTAYAGAWRAFLGDRGLPAAPAVEPASAAARRIDGTSFGDALLGARRLLGDPLLGVHFGQRVGGGSFGLLGIAAATAPTFAHSIHQLQRFEPLTSTLGRVEIHPGARSVTLAWRPIAATSPAVVEGILAGWVSFGRHLLGEHVDVREIAFAHPRGAALSAYEAALDGPVRFDADVTSVTVSADLLDARPRGADGTLNAHLCAWLDGCTLPMTAPDTRTCTRRVAQWLASAPSLDAVDEPQVAAAFGLGPRTLQRRLAAEGSGFRALLDAARGQRAIVGLLRGTVTLASLGAEVGFDEQSSLCRAFRRWTGYAPLALRARLPDFLDDLRPPGPIGTFPKS